MCNFNDSWLHGKDNSLQRKRQMHRASLENVCLCVRVCFQTPPPHLKKKTSKTRQTISNPSFSYLFLRFTFRGPLRRMLMFLKWQPLQRWLGRRCLEFVATWPAWRPGESFRYGGSKPVSIGHLSGAAVDQVGREKQRMYLWWVKSSKNLAHLNGANVW